MHWGCSQPVDDDAGGIHGEFGTLVNADNYAIFALSIYFQENFHRGDPFEPSGPWRDIPKWMTNPVKPKKPSSNTWANLYDNATIATMDTLAPDYKTTKTQSNTPWCVNGAQPDHDQQPFSRSDAINSINDFCSHTAYWDLTIVPPISMGTGSTKNGKPKATGVDNSKGDNRAVDNGIWLMAKMAQDGCSGSFPFGHGNTADQKKQYCVDRYMTILDNCQTDTTTAKYGGALQYGGCEWYQIAGRTANMTDIFKFPPNGNLTCTRS
ncbi:hypothetical protein CJF30_00005738 [Rutstroemia sp. NJR-2017a BBW]|nr:hypothetical protein CJF30_00005738 [Rutstroemia sp. NJR-2017a BBW]